MTELEKMTAGLLYNCDAPEYQESWKHAAIASEKFNSTSPLDDRQKEFYILNLSEKYIRVKEELLCG